METLVLETKLRSLVRDISLNTMEERTLEMNSTNLRMLLLGTIFFLGHLLNWPLIMGT